MQLGVSTSCYYPRTTEDSLRILLDAGVKTIEVFFNSHSELEPLFLMQLRAMANDAGAQIVSVHPYTSGMEGILFFSDYDHRFCSQNVRRLIVTLVIFTGVSKTAVVI